MPLGTACTRRGVLLIAPTYAITPPPHRHTPCPISPPCSHKQAHLAAAVCQLRVGKALKCTLPHAPLHLFDQQREGVVKGGLLGGGGGAARLLVVGACVACVCARECVYV